MNAGSRGASRASTGPPPAHGGNSPRTGGTAPRTLRSGPAVRRPTTPAGRGDDPALPGGRPGGRPNQPAQGVFRLADRALAPRTGTAPPPPLRRAEPRHRPGRGARESRRRLGRPPGAGAGRPAVRGGPPAGNRYQPVRQQDGVASPGARPRDPNGPARGAFRSGRPVTSARLRLRCSRGCASGPKPGGIWPAHKGMLYPMPPHHGSRCAGPPWRVPAASRLAHRPIRRPGPDVYNSVMCPVGLLHCHGACCPALAPGREQAPRQIAGIRHASRPALRRLRSQAREGEAKVRSGAFPLPTAPTLRHFLPATNEHGEFRNQT